jgi:hypothetical protein
MKNLKNFIQFNENLGEDYSESPLDTQDELQSDDVQVTDGKIKVYTVGELLDVDDEESDYIEVIKVDDLTEAQKEYLGILDSDVDTTGITDSPDNIEDISEVEK